MKTLNDHIILYDEECPMCNLYTTAFVKAGMLGKSGRSAYQHIPENICPLVDQQRAVNEIALVNKITGEVVYGVKSLFTIIGRSFPALNPLFSWQPFVWAMSKLYAFISYNRRVIIPASEGGSRYPLQPSFNRKYRIAYLLFTWFVASFILTRYAGLMGGLLPEDNGYREYLVCGGQIAFQALAVSFYMRNKAWDYLGNMMTVSFAGSLLLLIPLLVSRWIDAGPWFFATCFMAVAGAMFVEHVRRTNLLKLGWVLTASWVVYRLLVITMLTAQPF